MKGLHALLNKIGIYRKLMGKLQAADELFRIQEKG